MATRPLTYLQNQKLRRERDASPEKVKRKRKVVNKTYWRGNTFFISVGYSVQPLEDVLHILKSRLGIKRISYCEEIGEEQRKAHWHFLLYYEGGTVITRADLEDWFLSIDIDISVVKYQNIFRTEKYMRKRIPDAGDAPAWIKVRGSGEWVHDPPFTLPTPDCVSE